METVSRELFELKIGVADASEYMPRVHEIHMPCQWQKHCFDGKCPALMRKNGNLYCAKKTSH